MMTSIKTFCTVANEVQIKKKSNSMQMCSVKLMNLNAQSETSNISCSGRGQLLT